jgi:hypothetical protein
LATQHISARKEIPVENPAIQSVQGQVLRRSQRREAAIFLRDGTLWIADFIEGEGMLVDAATWIRFNCASASSATARRRMVLESALPLSEDLVRRIERLSFPGRPS